MATNRSRRGRRVGPPRFYYFPWEEEDRRARRERELAREARQWDEDRIRRFKEDQERRREYTSVVEIAEWYSELGGPVSPRKAAALREQAYRMLESDLLAGPFEEGGRSQVLFRCPGVSLSHGKMERQWLRDAIDNNYDGEDGRSYLRLCWLPRNLFKRWRARHHLPESPRFQPSQESRGRVSPECAERSPEPPMSAPVLAPQSASKLVVDTVDQPEVPSGIEPREIRVPPPQDGGKPRGLAHKDAPLPSDECSDSNTQPSNPSNKGGRPPAVDWEALEARLAEEIKIHGYPECGNPPGWRGTKDAADLAEATLGKESGNVSRRTIEDNVRKILRKLKPAFTAKPVSR